MKTEEALEFASASLAAGRLALSEYVNHENASCLREVVSALVLHERAERKTP